MSLHRGCKYSTSSCVSAKKMTIRRILSLIVHPRDVLHSPHTERAVDRAIASNALDFLQLRTTENDDAEDVVEAATELLAKLEQGDTKLIINHPSLELAITARAHGWHVKENHLKSEDIKILRDSIRSARELKLVTGCSIHSVEAAIAATECGVDYLQVGTMFPTQSHPEKAILEGPSLLREVRELLRAQSLPVPRLIAVGGISTSEHVQLVRAAGADGIAVIRGISAATDPFAAASYRLWLDEEKNDTSL